MGDSYIERTSKSAFYRFGHSPAQKEYLLWKANIIKENFRLNYDTQINKYGHILHRYNTNCDPYIFDLHNLCYIKSNKPKRKWEKIVNVKVLEKLSKLGLAIWYCDDGSYCIRDKSCAIATQGFTYDDNIILRDYLFIKWNLKCDVVEDNRYKINARYYKLTFNCEQSEKLLNLIKNYVPKCIIYKLGHISKNNKEFLEKERIRYNKLEREEYYKNYDKSLAKARKYREKNRTLINQKRVLYYWNNLEKSRKSSRKSMRKRRVLFNEKVNLINKRYYERNKETINAKRRKSGDNK